MLKKIKRKYLIVLIHILVWGTLVLIPALFIKDNPVPGLPKNYFLFSTTYHIGLAYLNFYYLYPLLVRKRTWWLYIFSLVALVFISYDLKLIFLERSVGYARTEENDRVVLMAIVPFLIVSALFRLIHDRIKFERLEKEKSAAHIASELKFLRSQVSPHFLFNTLTNLHALARKKSDLLEPAIFQLSELLRYMLYDVSKEKISIGQEIGHIENYLALQKLRFGEHVSIEADIRCDDRDLQIEPMLLVPFIENAFKHGVIGTERPFITIYLTVSDKQLDFEVRNSYQEENSSKDPNSGIGIRNVVDRLDLLYQGHYTLKISKTGQVYSIHLNLVTT